MRPKLPRHRVLPVNLTAYSKGGRVYYRYRNPKTKKFSSFGVDRQLAIEAATQANSIIMSEAKPLMARALAGHETLGEYARHWLEKIMPVWRGEDAPLADTTREEHARMVNVITGEIGYLPLCVLTQSDVAGFLSSRSSNEVFNKYRHLLSLILKHCVADGKIPENFAEKTVARHLPKKKRKRLSFEQYLAIYEKADPVLRRCMEFALNLCQRNGDLRMLKFSDVFDGHLHIVQSKTRQRSEAAYVRVPLRLPLVYSHAGLTTLDELIAQCRDNVVTPYILHRSPRRKRPSRARDNWAQLSPKYLSRAFAEVRDTCAEFADMAEEARPSFYEIVSLGMHLREESGWSRAQIQVLKGHATANMTDHYLDGHKYKTVEIPEPGQQKGRTRRRRREAT